MRHYGHRHGCKPPLSGTECRVTPFHQSTRQSYAAQPNINRRRVDGATSPTHFGISGSAHPPAKKQGHQQILPGTTGMNLEPEPPRRAARARTDQDSKFRSLGLASDPGEWEGRLVTGQPGAKWGNENLLKIRAALCRPDGS